MADKFITIKQSAALSGKSVQTIRRAVKSKKVTSRKKKTPQGYNYLVSRESLMEVYDIRIQPAERKAGGIKKESSNTDSADYASIDDMRKIQKEVEELLDKHEKAKESFSRFMKAFQERFIVMENQLKLLEDPNKKKRWYQFWK